MRVFLTGGTGFVGGRVVRRFVEGGHEVRCLARPASNTGALEALRCPIIRGHLLERASLLRGMAGCDAVVNVAGAYSFWSADRRGYSATNIEGTRCVMECALEAGIARVVHVSSIVVYGKPAASPVTEDTPVGPERFSEYGRTKYEGDLVVWRLRAERGLPLVVVYPGSVLGAGDPKASGEYVANLLAGRLPATILENASFPFVHVQDVAEAIVRAAEKPGDVGAKYILVGENLTFGQVNRLVADISGVRLPRMQLPAPVVVGMATALSALAGIVKRPPAWGLSLDQVRTMMNAPIMDGSRAARELGFQYTPIRRALEEAIRALKAGSAASSAPSV